MSQSRGLLSPIQTNFNENSLPATYQKRHMVQIVLSCFVLGQAHKISIDICEVNNILDANDSKKSNELVLWKVAIPYKDNQLNVLNEKFNKGKDIKLILGEELDSYASY
ncbi:3290_t:CDS:2, partial [Scutellospora calospora]